MRESRFWALEEINGRVIRSEHYVLEIGERDAELILPTHSSRRRFGIVLFLVGSVLSSFIGPLILQLGIPSDLTSVG